MVDYDEIWLEYDVFVCVCVCGFECVSFHHYLWDDQRNIDTTGRLTGVFM